MIFSNKKAKECEDWIAENGLMEHGGAKLKDYIKGVGISDQSHYNWQKQKPAYARAIESGKTRFKENLCRDLVKSLARAAKGYKFTEITKTTESRPNPADDGTPIIIREVKQEKTINVKSDVGAAIFLLCNLDPENYQNRQRNDITMKEVYNPVESLTEEEIVKEIERLQKPMKHNYLGSSNKRT